MAVGIHLVNVQFIGVDAVGNVVDKNDRSTAITQVLNTSHEHRVIPDAAVPNSSGYPTIKAYLELEAASNYILAHLSQNMIITYSAADLNSA